MSPTYLQSTHRNVLKLPPLRSDGHLVGGARAGGSGGRGGRGAAGVQRAGRRQGPRRRQRVDARRPAATTRAS